MAELKILTTHPEYTKYKDKWGLYHDAYWGEGGFATGGYLVPHPLEKTTTGDSITYSTSFQARQELAWYLNYCAYLVDAKHSHLFKKTIIRKATNTGLGDWMEDVDGRGTKFGSYLKEVQRDAQIYGHMVVSMDRPFSEQLAAKEKSVGYVTKGDEKALGIHPYLHSADPTEMVDWALDRVGNFLWVKLKEVHYKYGDLPFGQTDPMLERTPVNCLRIWTRETMKLYALEQGKDKTGVTLLQEQAHNLGVVPTVVLYNAIGKKNELSGKSALHDIVGPVHRLYNLLSELDEWLRNQAFSVLTFPVHPDDTAPDKIEVGSNRALPFNATSATGPQFISADPSSGAVLEQRIVKVVEEIHRLGNMKFKGGVVQSGAAWAFDWEEVNNSLRSQAQEQERSEMKLVRLWHVWDSPGKMPEAKDLGYEVQYPESYSYSDEETVMSLLEEFMRTMEKNVPSEIFVREYIKDRVHELMPNLPKDKVLEIWDEIDKWDPELPEQTPESNYDRWAEGQTPSDKDRILKGNEKPPTEGGDKDNAGKRMN